MLRGVFPAEAWGFLALSGWPGLRPRAVDKVVAQVSQPAVSQGLQPAGAANLHAPLNARRAAD